jgi:hypothetical protein
VDVHKKSKEEEAKKARDGNKKKPNKTAAKVRVGGDDDGEDFGGDYNDAGDLAPKSLAAAGGGGGRGVLGTNNADFVGDFGAGLKAADVASSTAEYLAQSKALDGDFM